MNRLPILIKREFWEHRAAFLTVPIVMVVLVASILGLGYLALESGMVSMQVEHEGDRLEVDGTGGAVVIASSLAALESMSLDERQRQMSRIYWAASAPFYFVLCFVTFFYLLDTLYQDRKDRSVLFWKSMPVSDFQTVLAKLLTATIGVPVVYLMATMVVQTLLLLLGVVIATIHGIPVWDTLLVPSLSLPGVWFSMAICMAFVAFWSLPYHGWLLLVSAAARSVPFIWAVGIPILVIILDGALFADTGVAVWIGEHLVPMSSIPPETVTVAGVLDRFMSVNFLVAALVGAAFIYGAVWFRGKGDEI